MFGKVAGCGGILLGVSNERSKCNQLIVHIVVGTDGLLSALKETGPLPQSVI
jgi:hypothetical protein